jgi:hypothetical protein
MSNEYISLNCPRCGGPLPHSGPEIICAYCGARLILRQSLAGPGHQPANEQTVLGHRLTDHVYQDQYTGLPAFRLLMPASWQFQGGISWLLQRPGSPTNTAFQIINPVGSQVYEALPNQYFQWMNNPGLLTPPRGTLYFGYEIQPPRSAPDAVYAFLLPRFRQIPGLEVVSLEAAPDWVARVIDSEPIPQNAQFSREGVRLRVRYQIGGHPLLEEILAIVEYLRIMAPVGWSYVDTMFWSINRVVAWRDSPEQFEESLALFNAINASVKPNPQWEATVRQISQSLAQGKIREINQIGAMARQIGRQMSEVSDMISESYWNRQRSQDHAAKQFSEAIRGVDGYYDPVSDRHVELPGGYRQAWTNSLGEYILSDDPSYNPNIGSNVTWTEMPRQ